MVSASWKDDLAAYRGLSETEIRGYDFLLSWLDQWRQGKGLAPGREAAVRFWRERVLAKPREEWQLDQWAAAVEWNLDWLAVQQREGREVRSLPERMKLAVLSAGACRGLALNTRRRYAGLVAKFGAWAESEGAGSERVVLDVEKARAWLTHLVEVEGLSFASQKLALNSQRAVQPASFTSA